MSEFLFILFYLTIFTGCIPNINGTTADEDTTGGTTSNGIILLNRAMKSPWNDENLDPDDIRCYCNLPVCVTTGYMCRTARSTTGGCFSEMKETISDKTVTRHGCIELLQDDDQKLQCDNVPRKHPKGVFGNTLLLCCQENMCNHVDNPDNTKRLLKPNLIVNNSEDFQSTGVYNSPDTNILERQSTSEYNSVLPDIPTYNSNEVWFKVATIIVPIFGGLILFALIAMAIKLLKTDNIDSPSKLGSPSGSSRKATDYEAYGTAHHPQTIKSSPLLKHYNHMSTNFTQSTNSSPSSNQQQQPHRQHQQIQNHPNYQQNPSNYHYSDKKNETQAKLNQLMNLEYSLLPQSCNDPLIKPTNTEINGCCPTATVYRNINLSLQTNNKCKKDTCDKIYDKEIINQVTANWTGSDVSNSCGM